MARGGAAPYRKGAAYENEVKRHLEKNGCLVTRQPKSQSPYDLHCLHPSGYTFVVQCKLGGRLPHYEREKLVAMSEEFPIVTMLASGRPIALEVLSFPGAQRTDFGEDPVEGSDPVLEGVSGEVRNDGDPPVHSVNDD